MKHISELTHQTVEHDLVPQPVKRIQGVPESCYHKQKYDYNNNSTKSAFSKRPEISRFKFSYKRYGKSWQVPLFTQDYLQRWIDGVEIYTCNEQAAFVQQLTWIAKPKNDDIIEAKFYMSLDEIPYTDRKAHGTDYSIVVWHYRKGQNTLQPFGSIQEGSKWRPGKGLHDVVANLAYWKRLVAQKRGR